MRTRSYLTQSLPYISTKTLYLTIPRAFDVQVRRQVGVREREKLLEASCDVDGVWGEREASGIALFSSMLASAERSHAKQGRPKWSSHVSLSASGRGSSKPLVNKSRSQTAHGEWNVWN